MYRVVYNISNYVVFLQSRSLVPPVAQGETVGVWEQLEKRRFCASVKKATVCSSVLVQGSSGLFNSLTHLPKCACACKLSAVSHLGRFLH